MLGLVVNQLNLYSLHLLTLIQSVMFVAHDQGYSKRMSPAPGRTMMRHDSRVARPVLENHRHPPPSSARAAAHGEEGKCRCTESRATINGISQLGSLPARLPGCLLLCFFGFCSILLCCCCRGFVFMAQLGTDAILWYAIASASRGFVVLRRNAYRTSSMNEEKGFQGTG